MKVTAKMSTKALKLLKIGRQLHNSYHNYQTGEWGSKLPYHLDLVMAGRLLQNLDEVNDFESAFL